MCTVDYTMRQCNGVELTTDKISSDGKITQIQAAKFNKVGDFNYMVYASRNKEVDKGNKGAKNTELLATLQIYSPRHKGPVYEVYLPFYTSSHKEDFWIGFCLRGGHGINYDGVSVSDPHALRLEKPKVQQDCILDREHIATVGIAPPTNVNAKTLTQDTSEVTWTEPTAAGGSQIHHYRIFVTERDNAANVARIETNGNKTTYNLKTPRAMWGKDYVLTVQAINGYHKISLLSEPAIFSVNDPIKDNQKVQLPSPIIELTAVDANSQKISLSWQDVSDAYDYKLYWDRGDRQRKALFYPLVTSTHGKHYYTLDAKNTDNVLGSKSLMKNGATFYFKVSYLSKKQSAESEIS